MPVRQKRSDRQGETTPEALTARLRALPAFANLSPGALAALAARATLQSFEKREEILAEGELASSFYIVLGGRAKMLRSLANGRSVVVALFGPGELFGTVAALGGQACDASLVALESTLCLKLGRDDLIALIEECPQRIGELLPLLTRELVECKNCMVEMTCHRVEKRFAQLLLKLGDSVGQRQDGGTFIPVPLSRQELADMTGTTIESCIRVMSRWGKSGLVDTEKGGFLLRRRTTLVELANA